MEIIGGIILLGFVILVLTGLGILTTAIFNISLSILQHKYQ